MKYLKNKGKNPLIGRLIKQLVLFTLFIVFTCFDASGQHTLIIKHQDTVKNTWPLKNSNNLVFRKLDQVINKYRQKGFLEASIDSVVFEADSSVAFLKQGKKYSLKSKLLVPEKEHADTIHYKGQNFNKLYKQVAQKTKSLRNQGYPFTSAAVKVLSARDSIIFMDIVIDRGRKITVDTIIMDQKNPPVSASFLHTFLGIQKGDIFNENQISKISEKIEKLEFLELIQGPSINFRGSKARLKIKLKEKASNSFDGIIGFSTEDQNQLKLNGHVMTQLQNILQQGENLDFQWQSPGNKSQSLDIAINFPYLLSTPFGIHSRFELYKQDSSYLNLKFRAGIQYRFTFNHLVEMFYHRNNSNVINPGNTTINENYYNFSADGFGVSYHFHNLDAPTLPHKGWNMKAEFTGGYKNIKRDPTRPENYYDTIQLRTQQLEVMLKIQRYLNPFPRFVFLFSNESHYLSDEQIGKNQLFHLGGINDLKGFDENALRLSAYSLLNTEIRFLLEQRSFLSLFWNGAIAKDFKQKLSYPMGFGAGLAFQTKTGIFSLYYALGKSKNSSVKFRNSKLHFGFISRF